MKLEWPQITYLTLMFIRVLLEAHLHGKPKTGEYNIFTTLISIPITIYVMYAGGFFTE